MKFIEIILTNSKLKEAKLYRSAKIAAANPETGVIVQNKSAYHVIKDSAIIAVKYLPHLAFGWYADPFAQLSGKFTKADIKEFVDKSKNDITLNQLLILILNKLQNSKESSEQSLKKISENFVDIIEPIDPYGDYGTSEPASSSMEITDKDPVEILCSAFSANQ